MAGASFRMDFSRASSILGNALTRISDRQELSETLGEQLVSSTIERFEDEKDPDGNDWKKSKRAEDEGGQTLSDKGHLKGSINYEASPIAVTVGTTDQVKGAVHQFGNLDKPKMPARPYIGLNQEDVDEAAETIRLFIQQGLGGR